MCHCAENRALLRKAWAGGAPVGDVLAKVGANVVEDVSRVAASIAAGRLAAARARLRR